MSTNNIIFHTKIMVVVIENVCGEVVKVHSTPSHHPNFPIIILIFLSPYHYRQNYLRHDPLQDIYVTIAIIFIDININLENPLFYQVVYWVSFKAHWKILYTYL